MHIQNLKKQNEEDFKEFNKFKDESEKIINNYKDLNEKAYQKILEIELSKVNVFSEEIIIQPYDINQQSKENLQQLQNKLKDLEFRVKEMREENTSNQEKFEKLINIQKKNVINPEMN